MTLKKTALHPEHVRLSAKMTDFHTWDMPLYYTSILEEHQAVRTAAGIFDISHMGQVLVTGSGALATLNELVVSDLTQLGEGRACYTMMLNPAGGIVDDIIIYRLGADEYVVIINCGTREKDVQWLLDHQQPKTSIRHVSDGRAIVAVQGPKAAEVLEPIVQTSLTGLGRFSLARLTGFGSLAWVARTGYTGSDGFEFFLEDPHAVRLWSKVLQAPGVLPAGLGARDTLRLEAGLRLYGSDMDDATSPYEADLGWTVAIHKPSFIGKAVLVEQKQRGVAKKLVGLELPEGPVPRHGCPIMAGEQQVGAITSGTFSLMLNRPIGMGYVESGLAKPGTPLTVVIRNKPYPAAVVKMPFWRLQDARPAGAALHQES